MDNLFIKLLDQASLDEVAEFISKKKVWKNIDYNKEYLKERLLLYCTTNERSLFICKDENGNILSTLGVTRWKILPYYNINLFHSNLENNVPKFKIVTNKIWTHVLGKLESEGRHSFYWCIRSYPLASLKYRKQNVQLKHFVPALNRYFFNTEALLNKNSLSNYLVYNNFVDIEQIKKSDDNFEIKRGTLMPEYFNSLD